MQIYLDINERKTIKSILEYIVKEHDWEKQINFLFEKFYNPKVQQKKIFDNIQLLPNLKDFEINIINHLKRKNLIEILEEQGKIIPKPLCVLAYIYHGDVPNDKIRHLLERYHQNTASKLKTTISKFGIKDKTLTFKEISPLIFLLYNNNTSKIHGGLSKNIELKRTIDRINYAFIDKNQNTLGTKDQDAALSGWYLAQANNKLGLPIWNKKIKRIPHYYIKGNRIKDVENAIIRTIKKDIADAKNGFKVFEIAFEKNSRVLFKFNYYFSTKQSRENVKKLFRV